MRRVWITRRKASAASLAKMKVYMEDPENGNIEINGCPCRKLGVLKNNQKKYFDIGYDETKIFVVAGKPRRKRHYEFVQIPEGKDDIVLTGRNCFQPGAGSHFRFDGVTEEPAPKSRDTGHRSSGSNHSNRSNRSNRGGVYAALIIAMVVCILTGVLTGTFVSEKILEAIPQTVEARTFESQGLQITLTEEFLPTDADGYTACYSSGETAVFVLREDFSAMEDFAELSLEDYGAKVLASNGLDGTVTLKEEGGLTTFDWVTTDVQTGTDYYYCCGLYKGSDAFWMVQVTAAAERTDEAAAEFRQWLASVTLP